MFVNPFVVERIEVVRGLVMLWYGGGAMVGVVNVIMYWIFDKKFGVVIVGEVFGVLDLVSDWWDLSAMLEGEVGFVVWYFDGLVCWVDDYEILMGG